MDVLHRIKRLVFRGDVRFTVKALDEMEADGLIDDDVLESILNASAIAKTIRSRSPQRRHAHEKLYVITSPNFSGVTIYTKGAIIREEDAEYFYIFVSAKAATHGA